jgi:hypothetical protein
VPLFEEAHLGASRKSQAIYQETLRHTRYFVVLIRLLNFVKTFYGTVIEKKLVAIKLQEHFTCVIEQYGAK